VSTALIFSISNWFQQAILMQSITSVSAGWQNIWICQMQLVLYMTEIIKSADDGSKHLHIL
jgi:hypothetical protein